MTNSKTDYGVDGNKAIPRVLMVEKFREGEVGLKRAISTGQLMEFVANGVEMIGFRSVECGEKKTHTELSTINKASLVCSIESPGPRRHLGNPGGVQNTPTRSGNDFLTRQSHL